jgi:RimJ/RimL family protein N-acetyltransferase
VADVQLRATIPAEARAWRNDARIFKWCRQHTLISQAQHDAWLSRIETDPSIKMFGIWVSGAASHGNTFVGVCGLTSINRLNQTAEFSLYIAPEFQRMGYAKQSLKLLLAHGFFDHNLNTVYGETFDGNPALKMFMDLGMQKEATLRERYFREGRFIDVHIVSMIRREFESRYC